MEVIEFDSTLGGAEHLPETANSLKFAAARSVEIAAMTEAILRPSKTKLIFQTLPVHMRRRVMSHNSKRLPRKLREGHMEQLKKSGLPPAQKRPSRRYRRRPANLTEEYMKRQKRNLWLETHIWHAKRFHMKERWGYRLPYAPSDKAFRACYRATSAHCLMQDISYYTPILITGSIEDIKNMFSGITNKACGLSICAKAYTNGKRAGVVNLFKRNMFPFGFIGTFEFLWVPWNQTTMSLLLFIHPAQINEIQESLKNYNSVATELELGIPLKKQKIGDIKIETLSGMYNRIRLTGPKSHAVLTHSLKHIDNFENIKSDEWVSHINLNDSNTNLKEHHEYWKSISTASSPSQLPSKLILNLVVRDPRLSRPNKRTKAKTISDTRIDIQSLITVPNFSVSPLWDVRVQEIITKNKISNHQFIQHITNTQLIPGEVNETDPFLQTLPIVLIQRPGSQNSSYKRIGYGSGWDIIIPSGYCLPFWLTFIMFGARAGGLRESENLSFEMGTCYMPPDSEAGKLEEKRIETEMKEIYFRLPPSKRVNYVKLAINSPFVCPWKTLLQDWDSFGKSDEEEFYILRDKEVLSQIQKSVSAKKKLPNIHKANRCLVAVHIEVIGKGMLKRHAHICLPELGDISMIKTLSEPPHEDPNNKLRKEKRIEHLKTIKRLRRKKIKMKKKGQTITKVSVKTKNVEPSDYVKSMRELWLPSEISSVRYTCTRQIMGFIHQGAYSFTEAKSCGLGYVAYNSLVQLLERGLNQLLVRNTCSSQYRLAKFHVIIG